ncbi:MAG: hypothetical protein ACRYG7_54720 [Janthinobacterium lividum]
MDATRFHLRSVVPIVRALPPALLLEEEALNELTTRLKTGLPTLALPPTGRPDPDAGSNPAARQPGPNPAHQWLGGCRAISYEVIWDGTCPAASCRLAIVASH